MHVAALAQAWGADALRSFLAQMKANGVRLVSRGGRRFHRRAAADVQGR